MERAECNSRTAKKVLRHLVRYQKRDEAEKNNYKNKIKRKIGMSPSTVSDAMNVLKSMGVISNTVQEGRKTIYFVHPGVVENMEVEEEFEEEESSRPSLARSL